MNGAQVSDEGGLDELGAVMADMGRAARAAADRLALASGDDKNRALHAIARHIRAASADIIKANRADMDQARANGRTAAYLDRLELTPERVEQMAASVEGVAGLADPAGTVIDTWTRPNGLEISRVRVPLGVIGIIYESRPNVTADAGVLCLKSGNAAILRGGSDGFASAKAITACLKAGLAGAGLPEAAIQMVPTSDRAAVGHMLAGIGGALDVIVPRGGKSLVARVQDEARVPVFAHLEGLCHVYVDKGADAAMARTIVLDAKMRRTGICGAAETLLVDRAAAPDLLKALCDDLMAAGCEVRGDGDVVARVPGAVSASDADWSTEYLDAIISVRLVDGVDGALAHMAEYGSQHTDAIVTGDDAAAEYFLARQDSAIVLHNASTQFADGGEFGFGAEIGIATGRFHARGPVGLEQLTTIKYQVRGSGQARG